jgi:hypothetical protein
MIHHSEREARYILRRLTGGGARGRRGRRGWGERLV